MQQLNLNSFFAIEPSILGMAYQVTCAALHHSVLLRINHNSCICLSHSFQIYVVGMIIKLYCPVALKLISTGEMQC